MANLHTGGIKCVRSSSDEVDANALVDVPAEIARRDLVLLEQIGNGNFGDVHKALYNTHTTASGRAVDIALPVAVKTLKEFEHSGAKAEFLREAAVTWQFQHKNVVQMHGRHALVTPAQFYAKRISCSLTSPPLRRCGDLWAAVHAGTRALQCG